MALAATSNGMTDAQEPPIRNAATVILWRREAGGIEVLMGQRGSEAAFMPNKVVFPGGAVDAGDHSIPLAALPRAACLRRLAMRPRGATPEALLSAAIRELWEETGLALGCPGPWDPPSSDWRSFAQTGAQPSAGALVYVFRAVTPPGRSRRFDARFFLAPAHAVVGSPDDFSHASDELSHLQWIPLARMREHNLPFITQLVLAEIGPLIEHNTPPESVPMVINDDMISGVTRHR